MGFFTIQTNHSMIQTLDKEVYYHMNEPDITSSRIADGEEAVVMGKPLQAPWAVSIHFKALGVISTNLCSGVLIAMNWVLTAAHCIDSSLIGKTAIRASPFASAGFQTRHVNQTFNSSSGADLALIQTDRPFGRLRDRVLKRHYSINTVCLPQINRTFTSGNVTVFGFGYISDKGWQSDKLQKAILKLWAIDLVSVVFCKVPDYNRLCASSIKGRTCRGDSGGGWVQYNDRYGTQAVVIGIHKGSDRVSTGCSDYKNHQKYGINTNECGLRYEPILVNINYPQKCFQTNHSILQTLDKEVYYHMNEPDITSSRITDGEDAVMSGKPLIAPWAVSIHFRALGVISTDLCSGVLIAMNWVLTAAHCLHDHWSKQWVIRASPYKSAGFQTRYMKTFIASNESDVGLIQTGRPFDRLRDRTLKRHYSVNTVCLPEMNKNFSSGNVTVFGFGVTGDDDLTSDKLQKAILELWSYDVMSDQWCAINYGNNTICGSSIKGRLCQGDSGGGWIRYNDRYGTEGVVLGIHSKSERKCFQTNHSMIQILDKEVYYHMYKPDITLSRIVDGENAVVSGKPLQAPWAVSIHFRLLNILDYEDCSGVLIAMNWILTAAHCIDSRLYGKYVLRASPYRSAGFQTRHINQTFNSSSGADIALIQTDRPFDRLRDRTLKRHYSINTVCLPEMNKNFSSGNVTVFGFGYTGDDGSRSDKLHNAILELWSFDPWDLKGDSGSGWIRYNDWYGTQAIVLGIHSESEIFSKFCSTGRIFIISQLTAEMNAEFVSKGDYKNHQKYGINTNECGLKYEPILVNISYPKKCFQTNHSMIQILDKEVYNHMNEPDITSSRVADGEDAVVSGKPLQAPWAYCSGVLIAMNWVLTAAHCVEDHWSGKFVIRASPFASRGFQTRHINQTFNSSSGADVTLIQTDRPFTRLRDRTLKRHYSINTVCLPEMHRTFDLGNVTVFGFGYTGDDRSRSDKLQKAILELWSYDPVDHYVCDLRYGKNHMCARSMKGRLCGGDSGSGWIRYNDRFGTQAVVLGVYSRGDSKGVVCSKRREIAVSVSHEMQWILNTISNNIS
ncbi:unnamed protein product [Medioppia subpectinata]|uniref:Peptidase S1 domain-containing protein n=1 Tax=Medioppia subpectinata TaxID=1979941 RepID=A0A7R9KCH0_9ACAR|nr:unnamed protein product [Medioppia subpectinata]CAG2100565.1 unnamed protein product [Medioppia subpectinata]